ncbi:MAG: AAA family ATPase [Armatimonadetes bacterium]|nr:AAA family ATPase [Armatimonadota bacterium]
MEPFILQTKLRPTFVSNRLLHRDHLLRTLNRLDSAKLVLVHGEAGAGKSSLLYDFVQQAARPVAWYSLDEADRDPSLFFQYFFQALESVFPGVAAASRAQLEQSPEGRSFQQLVTDLVNQLVARPAPVTVVLDDYHLVEEVETITSLIEFLVMKSPPNFALIVASRTVPRLPMPYLRSKGLLIEVGPKDLRFSQDEVGELFREVWEHELDERLVERLHQKTEGWVTGLQLVYQTIRDRSQGEIEACIERLQGKDEFIYEYLATEVFALQPAGVRNFLKFTSIVDRFNPALAQELAGGENAYRMLHYLDSARLFLVHLDRDGEWFRYHHLFRDFLIRKLAIEDGPPRARALHLRAARWLEQHGDVIASVPHFVQGGDGERAATLLAQVGEEMLARGFQASLSQLLSSLPSDRARSCPALVALQADLYELEGDWSQAVDYYQQALHRSQQAGNAPLTTAILEKLVLCYVKYGETQRLLDICDEALVLCDPADIALHSSLCSWLGAALIYAGMDWDRGYELIREGYDEAFRSNDPRAISWACITYGFVYHFPQGNLDQAVATLNEGIEYFRRKAWPQATYHLIMNKAVVRIFQGEVRAASDLIEDTYCLAERAGHVFVCKALELCRAMAAIERRDVVGAQRSLARIAEGQVPAQLRPWYFRTRVLAYCLEGNVGQARVAAEECRRTLMLIGYGMYAPECLIAQAVLEWRCGSHERARELLDRCLELTADAHAKFWEMKTLALLAVLEGEGSNRESAHAYLDLAMELTSTNRYYEFWRADPLGIAVPLAVESLAYGIRPETAQRILADLGDTTLVPLLELLESPRDEVRLQAIELLSGLNSERALKALQELRDEDPIPQVRSAARKGVLRHPQGQLRLEIQAFGGLKLFHNGNPISLERLRPQVVRLFKYLLCKAERLTPVDVIMEEFWPESPPSKARHNLSVHLSSLRKILRGCCQESEFITRNGQGYRLALGPNVDYDVREFERLADEGHAARRDEDLERAIARFLRAESLYRGDFLCDDLYDDWIEQRRIELRRRYLNVAEFLADRASEEQRYGEAANRYRKLLELDPVSETIFQKMSRCHALMGDRSSLVRDYERFHEAMLELTGLEPASSTQDLVSRLVED